MRLTFITHDLGRGPMVAGNARLARKLIGEGAEVSMLGLNRIDWKSDPQIPEGVDSFELRCTRAREMVLSLYTYIEERRPEYVVPSGYLESAAAVLAARLSSRSVKVIARTHEITSQFFAEQSSMIDRHFIRYILGAILRLSNHITAPSDIASKDLARYLFLPKCKVTTLPDPVLGLTGEYRSMTERFDHPWLHQKELTLICSVGRLSKEKDYSTLIKAFCIYRAKHPEARLLIFGEGEERRTLEALIRDRGLTRDVFLPGYRKDLSCAFKRMDVFVCSSTREGLNNALIEALSYGTRIVSTKCGGPENVLAGLEAELVAIGDAVALEQGISEALTSKKIDDSRVRRAKSYHVDQVYPEFRRLLMAA